MTQASSREAHATAKSAPLTPELARGALPESLESGLATPHLPCLDGLRAVAVFLVILYHFGLRYAPGGTGVLLFFVLSGFLITWLMLTEEEKTGSISLRAFYARRTLRIFPPFYFYAAVILLYYLLLSRSIVWPQTAASLLYVNDYYQALRGDPNTGLSHTWSLAIEEQFYLLWPVVFLRVRRSAHMYVWLAGFIGAVWLWRLMLVFIVHANQGYLYEAFDSRADSLALGCLLAILLKWRIRTNLFHAICSRPSLILITAAALGISTVAELRWGTLYRDAFGYAVNGVLFAVLLTQAIALAQHPLVSWLEWPWVRFLGRISYSLYLWQQFVLSAAESRRLADVPWPIRLTGAVAATIAAAFLSYCLIEQPALRLKRRFNRVGSGA